MNPNPQQLLPGEKKLDTMIAEFVTTNNEAFRTLDNKMALDNIELFKRELLANFAPKEEVERAEINGRIAELWNPNITVDKKEWVEKRILELNARLASLSPSKKAQDE